MAERELTYGEAVKEAIAEEMRRDPRVFLIGEDVAEAGHPFKTLVGLVQEFGTERVIDTPISEPGYAGIGVGAAMTGMRPIVDVMFGDFITLTMDQMVNQAAKAHYMSGGKIKVPIVFRTTLGRHPPLGRPALAVAARLGEPRPRPQGGAAVRPLRGQGPDEDRHPRRQPGGHLRGQDDVPGEGPGAGRGLHDPVRRGRGQARRQGHHHRGHQQHGDGGARRRQDAGGGRASAPR